MVMCRPQKKKKTGRARGSPLRDHKRKFTLPRALRARRASELLTKHAATRNQHAPHLDLSPIFPLKYKTKTKIPRANADATRLRGAMNNFSFWEFASARRWRLACAPTTDRVRGASMASSLGMLLRC